MSFNLTINDYPHYTYKDYEKWEGDWELIRGIPYAMAPAPAWQHQHFGSEFIYKIKDILSKKNEGDSKVLYESDWVISDDTIVKPDVMIVCGPIRGMHVTETPSLILEILSPSTVLKDRNTKFNLYQAYGVRYYLIADLGKKLIEVFRMKDNVYQETNDLTTFHLTNSCTIELAAQELFS
ncbi:MAG TPA: Uma2 family endonuclease [Flavisolibacter sp.]|nr:Uma2 family endonuclease [Flavisolibacter sp.]